MDEQTACSGSVPGCAGQDKRLNVKCVACRQERTVTAGHHTSLDSTRYVCLRCR